MIRLQMGRPEGLSPRSMSGLYATIPNMHALCIHDMGPTFGVTAMPDKQNRATPKTVQRTERGKDDRADEDEAMNGAPVESPPPEQPANMTRDKGIEPASENRHGARGEPDRSGT